MAATELRPRGAVGIVDAAVRLCARSGDLWALALPGGALVAAAITWLAMAISSGRGVLTASALLSAAWFLRSLFQGAAAHFAESTLVDPSPVSIRQALRAAGAHAPTLFITTATVLAFNLATLLPTFGFAALFLSSHLAAYAVAMKDAGHPLNIYATCSRVLGPARNSTLGVRVALWLVVLLALNLHIASSFLILLGRKLLGLDLVFLDRYASMDNPVWVVAVAAVAFTLTEPLRAAVGALLVVDGRVRKNGVDLQAAVAQLPKRRSRSALASTAAVLLACCFALPAPASAQEDQVSTEPLGASESVSRLQQAVEVCGGDARMSSQLEPLRRLETKESVALSRFLSEVEGLIEADECERAMTRLEAGLPMALEAQRAAERAALQDPAEKAKEILGRPEFAEAPVRAPAAPKEAKEKEPEEEGLFARFWKWLREALREWMEREPVARPSSPSFVSGSTFAWIIVVVIAFGIVGLVLWLVFRGGQREQVDLSDLEVLTSASGDADEASKGALARPPETWSSLADELAARGDYREAIRHLYLAVLSKLHGLGAIDYDPGLSNWDYLRRFRGALGFKDDFRELTFRFDYAFYGNEALSQDAYGRFRDRSGRILAADVARAEAANA